MPEMLPEVDHIKAFLLLLVGSALAAILIYIYDTTLAPSLAGFGL